jgi:hypothetical protein
MSEYVEKEKYNNEKQRLIAASFTAWQLGAGERKNFNEYLKAIGLSFEEYKKEPKMTDEEKKAELKKIDEGVERMMKKFRKIKKVRRA